MQVIQICKKGPGSIYSPEAIWTYEHGSIHRCLTARMMAQFYNVSILTSIAPINRDVTAISAKKLKQTEKLTHPTEHT